MVRAGVRRWELPGITAFTRGDCAGFSMYVPLPHHDLDLLTLTTNAASDGHEP
jgi:hypothetical protein